MSHPSQRDFTQGSLSRHLIAFSIPMFLGNLLQAFYNTVDSIWVGRFIGPEALGAVSISFPIIFALISLVMGIAMAMTTLVGQYRGAGNEAMVRRTIGNSLMLMTVVGLFTSAIGVIARVPILRLIETPEAILAPAASYLGIFLAGLIGMFIYNAVGAILRGIGDSRTPLVYLVYATVLNAALDPFFIFGIGPLPAMGVAGAALATVLSQGLSAALGLRYLARIGLWHWRDITLRFDPKLTRATFRIGLPSGVQQTVVSVGLVAVNSVINRLGTAVVAAFGAASRFDQFAFLPAFSVSMAISAVVAQNLGAGKPARARQAVRAAAYLTTGITAAVGFLAISQPDLLIVLFTTDPAVLAVGMEYLRIMGWAYVPFALMFMLSGVLRGAGDTVPSMFISIASLWLFRVPFAALLAFRFGLGSRGVWLAIALSAVLGLALNWAYYLTGRWQRRVVARAGAIGADPAAPGTNVGASGEAPAAGEV